MGYDNATLKQINKICVAILNGYGSKKRYEYWYLISAEEGYKCLFTFVLRPINQPLALVSGSWLTPETTIVGLKVILAEITAKNQKQNR